MKTIDTCFDLATLHKKSNFQIEDLDSEIRVDQLCTALLKRFHQYLLQQQNLEPLEAGSQAAGADYFLREFLIGNRRQNIFAATEELVRMFAGNWYIVNNLEPNMEELSAMLRGTANFYRYCAEHELVANAETEKIIATCEDTDYFQQRIDDFHDISGDGYKAWVQACPL